MRTTLQTPHRPDTGDDGPAPCAAEVSHRGQRFVGLVPVFMPDLGTTCYHSRKGVFPDGADVVMPLLHGVGPTTSHAGSMFALLNVLTGSKKKPGRSRSLTELRALPHHRPVGAVAIDLPGCNGTPTPDGVRQLDGYADWLAGWFRQLKSDSGTRLVPLARSASATPVAEINRRYPGLIDGVVLLSPMLPGDAEHSNADLLRRVGLGECRLNTVGFELMNTLNAQTRWDKADEPFGATPVLILTGGLDTQVSDRARTRCRVWADRSPHVEHINVTDATHDVLNLRNRAPALEAFSRLYSFLDALPSSSDAA